MFYICSMSYKELYNWPKPPSACPANMLKKAAHLTPICVAGLVILRQRPGTAKGVIFLTLEDETGYANIIIWRKIYEINRRAIISGRLLRVTGKLQHEGDTTHVIAEKIEDISDLLDKLIFSKTQ
jgi:DNA-directed RNA polymerase